MKDYNELDNLDEGGWVKLIKKLPSLPLYIFSKALSFGGLVAELAMNKRETNHGEKDE